MNDKFNYIIFHKGCLDGFAGFFVANTLGRLTRDAFIYQDVPSATRIPPNIDDKNIIIIDVAYKKAILEQIFKHAKSVVFIDHHVSIHNDVLKLQKEYKTNVTVVYDEKKSGCTLTWLYFNKRQDIPLFLKLIEDNDTGTWKYAETKPFIFAVKSYYRLNIDSKSIERWFKLMDKTTVRKLIKKGEIIKKYNDHLIDVNLSKHSREKFPSKMVFQMAPTLFKKTGQHVMAVFNGSACPTITDLAVAALDRLDCDIFIAWTYNIDRHDYVVSLRSKHVDVAKIAEIFGGGGHRLAAAFSVSDEKFRINDLFDGPSLPRQ